MEFTFHESRLPGARVFTMTGDIEMSDQKIGPGTDAPLSPAELVKLDADEVAAATALQVAEQNAALAEFYLVANAVSARDAIKGTVDVIRYIRTNRTHEHRTNPNTDKVYPNARGYIKAILKPYLSDWSGATKDAFILMLVDEGFTVEDSADITGSSKSKAERALKAADEESTGEAGKAGEPSTLLSRTVKALERVNDSALGDVDKFPTAGFKQLVHELERAANAARMEASRRSVNRPHSGSQGTIATGVTPTVAAAADKAGVKVTPAKPGPVVKAAV